MQRPGILQLGPTGHRIGGNVLGRLGGRATEQAQRGDALSWEELEELEDIPNVCLMCGKWSQARFMRKLNKCPYPHDEECYFVQNSDDG